MAAIQRERSQEWERGTQKCVRYKSRHNGLYMHRYAFQCFSAALAFIVPAIAQAADAEKAVQLALDGECAEAMPLLKQAKDEVRDTELKRKVGKGGVRCAMLMHQESTATDFLNWLQQEF